MDRIEAVLNDACEDQRAALRKFHETGAEADAARVHFESCLACERALDALATLRGGVPAVPPPIPGNRPKVVALFALTCVIFIGLVGALGYAVFEPYFRTRAETLTELERLETRVQFVRMPGRPDICVAAIQGTGGFGPTFMGAAPCDKVDGRVASDEDISWHLREYAVTRIRGTDTCLAHAGGRSEFFTLPCGSDD